MVHRPRLSVCGVQRGAENNDRVWLVYVLRAASIDQAAAIFWASAVTVPPCQQGSSLFALHGRP
jgi:hypothetical protein